MMTPPLYSANLSTGTLKVPESRLICDLLLNGVTDSQWHRAIAIENILQKRNPGSAMKTAAYLRQRFIHFQPDLWRLVRDGSTPVAVQATLAATIKQSRLVGDFLDIIVREQKRQFKAVLTKSDWDEFIEQCLMREPQMAKWTAITIDKLRQNVFHILAEGGFLTDTKSLRLQSVTIVTPLAEYLQRYEEQYVLRCLLVGSE